MDCLRGVGLQFANAERDAACVALRATNAKYFPKSQIQMLEKAIFNQSPWMAFASRVLSRALSPFQPAIPAPGGQVCLTRTAKS